jgi:hypothetical protein
MTMNQEEFYDVYDEAERRFQRHNRGFKGQTVTIRDDFYYWVALVAWEFSQKKNKENEK